MPFKSKAQRRKFYAMANRGEISHQKVKEWEDATHGKKLPERVKKAVEAAAVKIVPVPVPVAVPVATTAGVPTIGKLKGQAMRKMGAYDYGVNTALQTVGLVKEAKGEVLVPLSAGVLGPLGAAVGGGVSAPEGQGWRGAGGAALGSTLGGIGGSLGGSLVGGLGGAGIAKLLDEDPRMGAALGSWLAGTAGGIGGSALGGHYGFRHAIDADKKKKSKTAGLLVPMGLGAGIGALAADDPIRGALMGAGIGGGASLGAGLGMLGGGGLGAATLKPGLFKALQGATRAHKQSPQAMRKVLEGLSREDLKSIATRVGIPGALGLAGGAVAGGYAGGKGGRAISEHVGH